MFFLNKETVNKIVNSSFQLIWPNHKMNKSDETNKSTFFIHFFIVRFNSFQA